MTRGGGRALGIQQPLGGGHVERPARGRCASGRCRERTALPEATGGQPESPSSEEAGTVRGAKSTAGASVTTGKSRNDPNVHPWMSGTEGGPCRQHY